MRNLRNAARLNTPNGGPAATTHLTWSHPVQTNSSRTSAHQRGMILASLILVNGIIGILVASLLPAVQSVREAGVALQAHEATAELGAKIAAEADASEALGQRLLNATTDAAETGAVLATIQPSELRARLACVEALRLEIRLIAQAYADGGSTPGSMFGLLTQADHALDRVQQSFTSISNVMK
ncbi:MAG: hypothetical protein GY946_28790 [bacterium]|nr:hypothetical protein [bacterium]